MSTLYQDLNLTNFPESVDQFLIWLNITASDGQLIAQYQEAMQNGNTTLANQILAQIPSATQKIITATPLNKLTQAMLAVERFYGTDIEPYITQQQTNWLAVIQQFSYQGSWESGTSYVQNNLVTYTTGGLTLVFLAIGNPPPGTVPTNTQYWRVLTIQGQQGASGTGLSYRQAWSSSTAYNTNDAVTYDGALWMALQASQNRTPTSGSAYWRLVMSLETATYPIQDTEPTTQSVGGLWFNTQTSPTQYYYLEPLTNEAMASEVVYGKEVYDDQGNLIIGTMPVPISLTITQNPTKMSYVVGESFDPAGMVVTIGYSDGSSVVTSGYTYSPTGALTAQDTVITISYSEFGVTVNNTLTITVISISPTLDNNAWAQISDVSAENTGSSYWSVGDAKSVLVNGTVGTQAFNDTYYVYIIGFNHNQTYEGTGITFGSFKTAANGGTDICLVDSHYQQFSNSGVLWFNMNHNGNTSAGGWKSCDMRYDILGSTDTNDQDASPTTATSPVANTLMAALPSDLRAVMKPMTIYTDNVGDDGDGEVTSTIDYLPLLAEFEIFGVRTNAVSNEQNYQLQYQYYIDGNSKIKYMNNSLTSTSLWWERSPAVGYVGYFCNVYTGGTSNSQNSGRSLGVAPIFRI